MPTHKLNYFSAIEYIYFFFHSVFDKRIWLRFYEVLISLLKSDQSVNKFVENKWIIWYEWKKHWNNVLLFIFVNNNNNNCYYTVFINIQTLRYVSPRCFYCEQGEKEIAREMCEQKEQKTFRNLFIHLSYMYVGFYSKQRGHNYVLLKWYRDNPLDNTE